jgi:hypothetical protein
MKIFVLPIFMAGFLLELDRRLGELPIFTSLESGEDGEDYHEIADQRVAHLQLGVAPEHADAAEGEDHEEDEPEQGRRPFGRMVLGAYDLDRGVEAHEAYQDIEQFGE